MTQYTSKISLRTSAITAGITILIIAIIAPFAEVYVYPKLVDQTNAAATVKNIIDNKSLFVAAMFSYLVTFIGDIILAWALYILLSPVNKHLSLLAAWFRLIFALTGLVALFNLVTVFQLLSNADYSALSGASQLNAQVMLHLKIFRSSYHFGIIFFSIHLVLLGYLIYRCNYIPKVMGIILIISGAGYMTDALKPFLFPGFNSVFITITFFGELLFMLWLLIKGPGIKELNYEE